jgi:cyclophilin family peptidyl-prolyl cis-trans isomerase
MILCKFFSLVALAGVALLALEASQRPSGRWLLTHPDAPKIKTSAPDEFQVRLQTTQGDIVLAIYREWSPHGVDRFYNLIRAGYYDQVRFSRISVGRWAQFGINGDPQISKIWRTQTILDDPRKQSNLRGTVAYAFAVPNGRTTQLFINLRDNSATHDGEPFVPIGRVVQGMEVADSLYSGYGESAGGGIRGGKQGPLFDEGNAYLKRNYPKLDYIKRATIVQAGSTAKASPSPSE